MDIAPTFLELAGVPHPGTSYKGQKIHPLRGRSLAPWLERRADHVHPAGKSTGWELFGRRAILQDGWKAVYVPGENGVSNWQLYDLDQDRGEITDLGTQHPEKLQALLALWRQYVDETGLIETPLSIFDTDPAVWLPK